MQYSAVWSSWSAWPFGGLGPLGFVQDYSDRLVKVYFDSIDRLDAARFRTKNRTYQQKQIWGLPLPLEVRTYPHNRCHWKVPFGKLGIYTCLLGLSTDTTHTAEETLELWLNELTTWCSSDGAVCLLLLKDSETACPAYVSRRVYVLGPPNQRVFLSLIYQKTWDMIHFL